MADNKKPFFVVDNPAAKDDGTTTELSVDVSLFGLKLSVGKKLTGEPRAMTLGVMAAVTEAVKSFGAAGGGKT